MKHVWKKNHGLDVCAYCNTLKSRITENKECLAREENITKEAEDVDVISISDMAAAAVIETVVEEIESAVSDSSDSFSGGGGDFGGGGASGDF